MMLWDCRCFLLELRLRFMNSVRSSFMRSISLLIFSLILSSRVLVILLLFFFFWLLLSTVLLSSSCRVFFAYCSFSFWMSRIYKIASLISLAY